MLVFFSPFFFFFLSSSSSLPYFPHLPCGLLLSKYLPLIFFCPATSPQTCGYYVCPSSVTLLPEKFPVGEGCMLAPCHEVDICPYSLPGILSSSSGSLIFLKVPVVPSRSACALDGAATFPTLEIWLSEGHICPGHRDRCITQVRLKESAGLQDVLTNVGKSQEDHAL